MSETSRSESQTLTFDESASDFIIDAMGWDICEHGYIHDEDGEPVLSPDDNEVRADHFAGVVEYKGEPRPLPANFVELVDYANYARGELNAQ